jgi:hypothetical protein
VNDNYSLTAEQVLEAIKQIQDAEISPANIKLLENWRELVEARRKSANAPFAENCNEPKAG